MTIHNRRIVLAARPVVGDSVVGMFGWQHYGLSDGRGITKIDTSKIPMSAFIGVMGMPGATAWYGLNRIIDPKPGETIVVSAAAGAVGAVVGQLAKFKACRVVGVAGGAEKCQLVTETFGFDACIDYKAGRLYEDLGLPQRQTASMAILRTLAALCLMRCCGG